MTVKVKDNFGSAVAQQGVERSALAAASGVSVHTIHALARPAGKDRSGAVREITAWKIARGLAKLTDQEPQAAFDSLFVVLESE